MNWKRLLISVLVLSSSLAALAQVRTEWAVFTDGPEQTNDSAVAAQVEAGGQIYVLGHTYIGAKEAFGVLKFDSTGNRIWASYFSDEAGAAVPARSLVLDAAGNAYVTGYAKGTNPMPVFTTVKFGPDGDRKWMRTYRGLGTRGHWASAIGIDRAGDIYVAGLSDGGGTAFDLALVKYDSDGNALWVARYAGGLALEQRVYALATDPANNVVVATSFTAKFSSQGTQLWVRPFGDINSGGQGKAVTVDGAGNIYVTGMGNRYEHLGDYFTVKYDAEGNELWTARYNAGVNDEDHSSLIAVDGLGNVCVSGWSVFHFMSGTDEDIGIATVKYDANGKELWVARSISTEGDSHAQGLAVDSQGRVIVTGEAVMQQRFRPRTIAYSADGKQLWQRTFEAPGGGNGAVVALDPEGFIYVAGGSRTARGDSDIALAKYAWEQAPGLPVITAAPQPQTRFVGQSVSFEVEAAGNPDLNYQWRLSGRPIADATNRVLGLSNLRSIDGGEYSVIVSNAGGWTISPEVRLLFHTRIKAIGYEHGQFSGRIEGDPYYYYWIEVSSDLESWVPTIQLPNAADSGTFVDDPGPAKRFYRAQKER